MQQLVIAAAESLNSRFLFRLGEDGWLAKRGKESMEVLGKASHQDYCYLQLTVRFRSLLL